MNYRNNIFKINPDICDNIMECEDFINICNNSHVAKNVFHERMFLRIQKVNDDKMFEIEEIEEIKKMIYICFRWNKSSATHVDLDLETNLFLCHKSGRYEELVEKNIFGDNVINDYDLYYEINQKYIFKSENYYYYDIPLFIDCINISDFEKWNIRGFQTSEFYAKQKYGDDLTDRYSFTFCSEKMKVIKNIKNPVISCNTSWSISDIGYYCHEEIVSMDVKNAIIKSKEILDIEKQNIEYYVEVYQGLFYYYFNTLDLDELVKKENITLYEPSSRENSSILAYYIFTLNRINPWMFH